eukprot:416593_1
MDILKAEASRAKAEALSANGNKTGANNYGGKKRYLRRGEVDRLKKEATEKEIALKTSSLPLHEEKISVQSQEASASTTYLEKKRRLESPDSGADAGTAVNSDKKSTTTVGLDIKIVRHRLRSRGLPITLFGETDAERESRLCVAEAEDGEHEANDFKLTGGHEKGQGGAVEEKDVVEDVEEEKEEGWGNDKLDAIGKTGIFTKQHSMASTQKVAKPENKHTTLRRFLHGLIREWEADLNSRHEVEKASVAGRNATKMQKQTKDYLRPLFKLCRERQLNEGILENLTKMMNRMKEGEFVKAHDVYMLTAIGNAPWPIGLTMVGIHERSGRERIESRNVAHIMNNEEQRKYLVSIKRLMTYLQEKRTDIPPSKKVFLFATPKHIPHVSKPGHNMFITTLTATMYYCLQVR